jgi:hypothetical protein
LRSLVTRTFAARAAMHMPTPWDRQRMNCSTVLEQSPGFGVVLVAGWASVGGGKGAWGGTGKGGRHCLASLTCTIFCVGIMRFAWVKQKQKSLTSKFMIVHGCSSGEKARNPKQSCQLQAWTHSHD